uniref:Transmembrane protein 221 n=1 Tax=Anser brachyrhynchus TaxID=132585 RepID=A0A8B9BFK5_9AVES
GQRSTGAARPRGGDGVGTLWGEMGTGHGVPWLLRSSHGAAEEHHEGWGCQDRRAAFLSRGRSIGAFPALRPARRFSHLFCRADWFLLDSRTVRHAAIGLFCCGVSVYLTALAIYMLLLFELEAGIASACILSSGIIVLLVTVTHALVRASQLSRRSRPEVSHTLYENDSAQHSEAPAGDLNNKNVAAPRPQPEIHREFSFPPFLERKPQLGSPASSNLTSSGSPGARSEQESYNLPRTHRTLSAESALLQAQGKPWNGVTREMRNVLARKPGASGKDSTLV